MELTDSYLQIVANTINPQPTTFSGFPEDLAEYTGDPKLSVIKEDRSTGRPRVVFRQVRNYTVIIHLHH